MTKIETRKRTALGMGGAFLLACCVAGPAILGAVGGAATGSVVLGAIVAVVVSGLAYVGIRLLKGPSENC